MNRARCRKPRFFERKAVDTLLAYAFVDLASFVADIVPLPTNDPAKLVKNDDKGSAPDMALNIEATPPCANARVISMTLVTYKKYYQYTSFAPIYNLFYSQSFIIIPLPLHQHLPHFFKVLITYFYKIQTSGEVRYIKYRIAIIHGVDMYFYP